MSALFIGPNESDALKAALARARTKPIPWPVLKQMLPIQRPGSLDIADRKPGAPERPPSEQVELPPGWTVAISVEEQPPGLLLHISISSPHQRLPHPEAVKLILAELGVTLTDSLSHWDEEFLVDGRPGGRAINLLFPLPGGVQ